MDVWIWMYGYLNMEDVRCKTKTESQEGKRFEHKGGGGGGGGGGGEGEGGERREIMINRAPLCSFNNTLSHSFILTSCSACTNAPLCTGKSATRVAPLLRLLR